MTTELYPDDYFQSNEQESPDHELEWMITEIIKPQIPSILDTLETCLELLNSDKSFKLPITSKEEHLKASAYESNNSNLTMNSQPSNNSKNTQLNQNSGLNTNNADGLLKGTITRTRGYITDYHLLVQFAKFRRNQAQRIQLKKSDSKIEVDGKNKKIIQQDSSEDKNTIFSTSTSTTLDSSIGGYRSSTSLDTSDNNDDNDDNDDNENCVELEQLLTVFKYTTIAIGILENLQKLDDIHEFKKLFQELDKLFILIINTLNKPMNFLQFPIFTKPLIPQLESQHHVIVPEILIISNEIVFEFRCLEKFNRKPWSNINKDGKSTCDLIKSELHDPLKKMRDILASYNITIVEPTFFHSLMQYSMKHDGGDSDSVTIAEAQDILNRSVTYQNKLYLELGKVVVSTSDPYLITMHSKLAALQKTIYNAHLNLQFV